MVFTVWRGKAENFNSKSNAKKTPIILLDEATSSLDAELRAKYRMQWKYLLKIKQHWLLLIGYLQLLMHIKFLL